MSQTHTASGSCYSEMNGAGRTAQHIRTSILALEKVKEQFFWPGCEPDILDMS